MRRPECTCHYVNDVTMTRDGSVTVRRDSVALAHISNLQFILERKELLNQVDGELYDRFGDLITSGV